MASNTVWTRGTPGANDLITLCFQSASEFDYFAVYAPCGDRVVLLRK